MVEYFSPQTQLNKLTANEYYPLIAPRNQMDTSDRHEYTLKLISSLSPGAVY